MNCPICNLDNVYHDESIILCHDCGANTALHLSDKSVFGEDESKYVLLPLLFIKSVLSFKFEGNHIEFTHSALGWKPEVKGLSLPDAYFATPHDAMVYIAIVERESAKSFLKTAVDLANERYAKLQGSVSDTALNEAYVNALAVIEAVRERLQAADELLEDGRPPF